MTISYTFFVIIVTICYINKINGERSNAWVIFIMSSTQRRYWSYGRGFGWVKITTKMGWVELDPASAGSGWVEWGRVDPCPSMSTPGTRARIRTDTDVTSIVQWVPSCRHSSQWCRRGEHGGTPFPQIFLWGMRSPNYVRTRGNGDTVTFHQIGLQRNLKSMVKLTALLLKWNVWFRIS